MKIILEKYIILGVFLVSFFDLKASTISQLDGDAYGESSFNTGTHWSDGNAPSSGNDYSTAKTLRTPAAVGDYSFAGNSLTITSGGVLNYKCSTASSTITINNLNLSGGTITNGTTYAFTLGGSIALDSNGYLSQSAGLSSGTASFTVASVITGSGKLNVVSNSIAQDINAVTLTGNNSYTGGTVINSQAYLIASSSNSLGFGNVTVNSGKLTLNIGTAISDSASLILSSSLGVNAITLNYSGVEILNNLSLNGGTTYLSAGTYSVTDLNGYYGSNVFSGTGQIQVIPETETWVLLGLGIFILAAYHSHGLKKLFFCRVG